MTRTQLSLAVFLVAAAALVSGCVLDGGGSGAATPRAACDICTADTMGGSGFALPQKGVVIYQGTVKIFDLTRRTFSIIETDPPLMRPHAATILARRDLVMSNDEYGWTARMTDAAWTPAPAKNPRGCASTDGRLPALVVLIDQSKDQGKFFADYECGPEDAAGQLSELTARADRFVAQRFPDVLPK